MRVRNICNLSYIFALLQLLFASFRQTSKGLFIKRWQSNIEAGHAIRRREWMKMLFRLQKTKRGKGEMDVGKRRGSEGVERKDRRVINWQLIGQIHSFSFLFYIRYRVGEVWGVILSKKVPFISCTDDVRWLTVLPQLVWALNSPDWIISLRKYALLWFRSQVTRVFT